MIQLEDEDKGSKGRLTQDQLLERYNGRMILERRLERFLKSGEIALKDGKYILVNNTNAFFMIDAVAQFIQKALKKSS